MVDFRKVVLRPEKVNVLDDVEGRIAESGTVGRGQGVPHRAPTDQLPRKYETLNDLLGQPGDKALQWKELGEYLGRGAPDEACAAIAANTAQSLFYVAASARMMAPIRGFFRHESMEFVRYFPTGGGRNYQYPPDVDLFTPHWVSGRSVRVTTFDAGAQYSADGSEFVQQVGSPTHDRVYVRCYPYFSSGPRSRPVIKTIDGVERHVVEYFYDTANPSSDSISPLTWRKASGNTDGQIAAKALVYQTAGPPLGSNSNIFLLIDVADWRGRLSGATTLQVAQVPFDANGRGFASLPLTADLDFRGLVSPRLFLRPLPQGVTVEVHYVGMRTQAITG